ncbi:hypothetical protein LCGC14_1942940 [marine sediment metagenome]|uniref:Uncharacterized protein n=1 Tax=marine sediment metagenome TaxID=412755 RepID=A0A0F9IGW2_9ZZZZ
MRLPTKEIGLNTYQFSPDTWAVLLHGKPHKASYARKTYPGDIHKRYIINKGNLLVFGDNMIYADHLWRVVKTLDHYNHATLTLCPDGIRISQTGEINTSVFLKWQEFARTKPLEFIRCTTH